MLELSPIDKSRQLFVEGRGAEEFFMALLRNMDLAEEVQIQNFGGINELPGFLQEYQDLIRAIRIAAGPQGALVPEIASIGIIRDAEEKRPIDAFGSVCRALKGIDLAPPSQIAKFEGDKLRIGVLILPDTITNGMLEDLCLRSVADDPVMQCIDEYFECVEKQVGSLPKNMPKAKVQAFLASRPKYIAHLGLAAQKNYWPWKHPAFDHVKQFLREL